MTGLLHWRHGLQVTVLTGLLLASLGTAQILRAEETAVTPAQRAEQEKFFEDRVRPLLAAKCWQCHGPTKQENDLRLDARASLLGNSSSGGPVTVPGHPDRSLLIKAVRHEGELKMPPEEKLPASDIELLETWVRQGLPWPATSQPAAPLTAADRAVGDRATHWSYQPVVRPPVPSPVQRTRLRTGADAFIAAQQEAALVTFSPDADRRTMVRRLYLDLLGLPPDMEISDEVLADESPDAVARLVDRLLASPHYGERWGRHWLDVARYADTKGYAFAQERRYPFAYTYRDYVVRAFNEDTPFDQFVLEQLAADQLSSADASRLAALGFLTTGRKFNNPHDDIDDKIDVVGRGLLGLTVGCARCHDHKYDAIPMEDYYGLYGVFASCHEPGELPLIGHPVQNAAYQAYEKELQALQAKVNEFVQRKRGEHRDLARRLVTDYLARILADQPTVILEKLGFLVGKPDELRPKLVERWRDFLKQRAQPNDPVLGPWAELAALRPAAGGPPFAELAAPILTRWQGVPEGTAAGQLNPLVKQALAAQPPRERIELAKIYGQLLTQVYQQWQQAGSNSAAEAQLSEAQRQVLQLLVAAGSPTDLSDVDLKGVLNRAEGNEQKELQKKVDAFQASSPAAPPRAMIVADNAQPHQPHVFLRGNPARPGKAVPRQFLLVAAGPERQPFRQGSGRLELAQAIVAPHNPLTRRVLVNRLWMYHLGEPLVSTPSDFGVRVAAPPQRELLDYLAATLLETGWSLKALQREIVLSTTFGQSSLDRPTARAVDAENRLYWRMNRKRLEFEPLRDSLLAVSGQLDASLYGRPAELTRPPFTSRRSVYGYIDRQDLPNLFRVFDLASPDQSSERRPRTTVPQQALFLLNSPFVIDQARALVRLPEIVGASDDDARVAALYRRVLGRTPTDAERSLGRQFVAAAGEPAGDRRLSGWEQYAQLLLLTNEIAFVD
ncbi:MAG: PSD1 and planctomycete cytochrome C domain-containing protein [Pirellulales bacterium]